MTNCDNFDLSSNIREGNVALCTVLHEILYGVSLKDAIRHVQLL